MWYQWCVFNLAQGRVLPSSTQPRASEHRTKKECGTKQGNFKKALKVPFNFSVVLAFYPSKFILHHQTKLSRAFQPFYFFLFLYILASNWWQMPPIVFGSRFLPRPQGGFFGQKRGRMGGKTSYLPGGLMFKLKQGLLMMRPSSDLTNQIQRSKSPCLFYRLAYQFQEENS